MKRIQCYMTSLLLVAYVLVTTLFYPLQINANEIFTEKNLQKEIPSDGVKVTFIQLTSGEATLIELENGENVLIDTGSSFSEKELLLFLQERNIDHLEHLFITNQQDEHFGNFKKIMEQYEPKHLYYPYYLHEYFQKLAIGNEMEKRPVQEGDHLQMGNDTSFQIFHPNGTLALAPKDNSLVFQFRHGPHKFLFTSDISSHIEKRLLRDYDLKSEILKVGDFGSHQASSESFLEEVDAHIAVIFYRPQHYLVPEVLERLEETWIDIYPLKKHGHLLIVSGEHDYEVFVLPTTKDAS